MEKEAHTANKGFAIAGAPCFADTFVQGGSSVLRIKFSAKNPLPRKAQKRWATYKKPTAHLAHLFFFQSLKPKLKNKRAKFS